MIPITANLSANDFVTAINNNLLELDILTLNADFEDISILNYIGATNLSLNNFNNSLSIPVTLEDLTIGMKGSTLISELNRSFSLLNQSIISQSAGNNYIYVSENGDDDTGNGTQLAPYKTINKPVSTLADNTKIFLEKDSVFANENVDLSGKTNISISSYGTGAMPIIDCLKSVTGWTDEGSSIWSKQDNNFPDEITNVLIGGVKALVAKVTGKTSTGGTLTSLVDSTIGDADGYWDNAEIWINCYPWVWNPYRVNSFVSKTFNFDDLYSAMARYVAQSVLLSPAGTPYMIVNHRNCLTSQNQWAYDNSTKTLYIFSSSEPTDVKATYGSDIIYADGNDNISVSNIKFYGAARNGIYIKNSDNVGIRRNEFQYIGYDAIANEYIHGFDCVKNTIIDSNSCGIKVIYGTDLTVNDNIIDKVEYTLGYARFIYSEFLGQKGEGINLLYCNHTEMFYNKITNTSYTGISIQFSSDVNSIYNEVDTFCRNRDDGGGIYTYCGNFAWLVTVMGAWYFPMIGGIISKNIVINGNLTFNNANIYIDESSEGFEVFENYVSGKSRWQIHSHFSMNNDYHDNTIFGADNRSSCFRLDITKADNLNNIINNNLFVVIIDVLACNEVVGSSTGKAQTITNNKYFYPFGKGVHTMFSIDGVTGSNYGYCTFDDWQDDETRIDWGRDTDSEITPSLYSGSLKPTLDFCIAVTNPSKYELVIEDGDLPYNDYLDMNGDVQNFPFIMQPYASKILVRPT